jgi:hypothetical protein
MDVADADGKVLAGAVESQLFPTLVYARGGTLAMRLGGVKADRPVLRMTGVVPLGKP